MMRDVAKIETEPDTEVELDWPPYRSTRLRAPKRPPVLLPERLTDLAGPVFGHGTLEEHDDDLTRHGAGEPLGERIVVTGRVLDEAAARSGTRSSRSGRRTPPAATGTPPTAIPRRSIRTSRARAAASPTTRAATAS